MISLRLRNKESWQQSSLCPFVHNSTTGKYNLSRACKLSCFVPTMACFGLKIDPSNSHKCLNHYYVSLNPSVANSLLMYSHKLLFVQVWWLCSMHNPFSALYYLILNISIWLLSILAWPCSMPFDHCLYIVAFCYYIGMLDHQRTVICMWLLSVLK